MNEKRKPVSNEECVHALNGIKGLMFAATENSNSSPLPATDVASLAFAIGIITDHIAANEGLY